MNSEIKIETCSFGLYKTEIKIELKHRPKDISQRIRKSKQWQQYHWEERKKYKRLKHKLLLQWLVEKTIWEKTQGEDYKVKDTLGFVFSNHLIKDSYEKLYHAIYGRKLFLEYEYFETNQLIIKILPWQKVFEVEEDESSYKIKQLMDQCAVIKYNPNPLEKNNLREEKIRNNLTPIFDTALDEVITQIVIDTLAQIFNEDN
jgi:hypothetical protein